ncbi:MAG: phage tail protein [Pyrinomonadaceae bacterium]
MSDPFVAEIRIFPFNFAPRGWAWCNGQLLPLSQNTALFSLLGTTYGGDGKSTFALPNMQGSAPMHPGQGPGLSLHDLGETGGSEAVSLLSSQIPAHSHTWSASNQDSIDQSPVGELFAGGVGGVSTFAAPSAIQQMNQNTLTPTGFDAPHNNMMPYLTLNFNIAMQGVFPPRS